MAGSNTKHPGGRPTVMTPETIGKLEQAFAYGASDKEACFYAGISRDTYYKHIKKEPELADRFEALRNTPVLKARKTIVDALSSPKYASWYLERKKKKEFAQRTELTGQDGDKLQISFDTSFQKKKK